MNFADVLRRMASGADDVALMLDTNEARVLDALVEAAVKWHACDYGDPCELAADGELIDAVVAYLALVYHA